MTSPTRDLGGTTVSHVQGNILDWCYFVRVDIGGGVGTQRFTNHRAGTQSANIDGTGTQTWTSGVFLVGDAGITEAGALDVSWLKFGNLAWPWTAWANSPGLRGAQVQVWRTTYNPTTGAISGQFAQYVGQIDGQQLGEWAYLSLRPYTDGESRDIPWQTPWDLGAGPLIPDEGTLVYFGDKVTPDRGGTGGAYAGDWESTWGNPDWVKGYGR